MSTKNARTILVVDDDAVTRRLVATALSAAYTVHAAEDAADALAILERIPVPDLIVCDVMMPKVTGINFVTAIRKRPGFERVPVVFLTAKTGPLDVVQGINAGARHYIAKPFKVADLLAKVAKIVG